MHVVEAAQDLIGRELLVLDACSTTRALIIETEAYGGLDDPASHAAFRPKGRASVMAGAPGVIYVYAAYGMYPCFNIVTDIAGSPSAVLVRGVWLVGSARPVLGPGRTTKSMGISLLDHGSSIEEGRIRVSAAREPIETVATSRVGITRGVDKLWRFVDRRVEGMRR